VSANSNSDREAEIPRPLSEAISYPTDNVVAVIADRARVADAYDALTTAGFEATDIKVIAGEGAADRLADTSGRTGFLDKVIRFADKLGVRDEEMEAKATYERALREDQHVISVFAPSEDRARIAADILRRFNGKYIAHFGEFVITDLRK
jgi:hypothetical protein